MSHFYDLERIGSKDLVPGVTLQTIWGEKVMLSRVEIAPGRRGPQTRSPARAGGHAA